MMIIVLRVGVILLTFKNTYTNILNIQLHCIAY